MPAERRIGYHAVPQAFRPTLQGTIMSDLASELNKEIAGSEATIRLTNGESFRMAGDVENVADNFIKVGLSNNPDKKGRMLVNIHHIVSIDWYIS
jgi:hypothetical protein